jgi:hypothetical protein
MMIEYFHMTEASWEPLDSDLHATLTERIWQTVAVGAPFPLAGASTVSRGSAWQGGLDAAYHAGTS